MADRLNDSGSQFIQLNVLDRYNFLIRFLVLKTNPLLGLMDTFCCVSGNKRRLVRFLYHGLPVRAEDSPASLEMNDGDTIEVHKPQVGGGSV
ncbi:ubiquitin-like protein SMT3 [Scaptodrosophila lebanonensis]|uniref:Ubiquitin-like protein SMT3 n=1 Tax=Drosophila lebanonensis TaxID=7225 RepID=A0A6J2TWI6_DROLE|nr:ubiquitin-like protein SMT3 [Scaptodrosophila lebanonensis]